jgi:hypothetical protein
MNITYYCPNNGCKGDDGKPYTQAFVSESYMDDKNIATMFCPRCHQRMVKSDNQARR